MTTIDVSDSCSHKEPIKEVHLRSDNNLSQDADNEEKAASEPAESYLIGWRKMYSVIGVLLATFLAMIESSIASTALIAITYDLRDFKISAWIINAYLVTFTGFLLIWVQFSYVIGRKSSLVLAFCIFIAFSAGCAGARTSLQLVIFRAFQGIGGAGVSNISITILAESIPPSIYPKYIALTSISYAFALAAGPLVGGGITSNTTWRWIFWINVPAAALALLFLLIGLPRGFPHHNKPNRAINLKEAIRKLDLTGAALFLSGVVMLITALQGGASDWEWSSAASICLFVFSVVLFIAFVWWERFITLQRSLLVPLLTWKFCQRRTIALISSYTLVSLPFTSSVVGFVERFQILNKLSPFQAGLRLLPFIATVPFVSFISALVVARLNIKHAYALFLGIAFQLVGAVCLLTAVPGSELYFSSKIYGFEVLLATGLGINNTLLFTAVPFIIEKPLVSTAIGAGMQFRYLGGVLGLGVLTAVLNANLKSGLSSILSPDQISTILQSTAAIETLPKSLHEPIRNIFYQGFQAQLKAIIAFIIAQIPATIALL